jgi:hypothetical protein
MTGKGPRRDLERERVWRAVLDRQRQSGLSIREFCRREVLAEVSFYSWQRELRRRDRESASVPHPDREASLRPPTSRSAAATAKPRPAAFLPVLIESSSPHVARVLEVICPDGSRVSAWSGCEVELLQAALSVVTRTTRVGRKGRVASC